MRKLTLLCLLFVIGCGGGGSDDRDPDVFCPADTPLVCSNNETCCPVGFAWACDDGLCYRQREQCPDGLDTSACNFAREVNNDQQGSAQKTATPDHQLGDAIPQIPWLSVQ